MSAPIVNLLIDESMSMRGAGLQSARQVALQVLRFVEERDRTQNEQTLCNVWTFSDEPMLLGAGLRASELLDLPLSGSGASMLDRALVESVRVTRGTLNSLRAQARNRRDFRASICSVLVSDLDTTDDWAHHGSELAGMGRLSLVLIGDTASLARHAVDPSIFCVIAESSDLSHDQVEHMLRTT